MFAQVFQQEIHELAALAYRETLKNFTADQIERGCRECLRTCKFFPKPTEIIEGMHANRGDYAPPFRYLPEPELNDLERKQVREMLDGLGKKVALPGPAPVVTMADRIRERRKVGR
jgi:hypothetical protein